MPYGDWLSELGLTDKKDELHEYDIREGEDPLVKLVEMLQDEEQDFNDMLEDVLEDDDDAQGKFRRAVEALRDESPGADNYNTAAAEMHAAWATLTRELGDEAAGGVGTVAAALVVIEELREENRTLRAAAGDTMR